MRFFTIPCILAMKSKTEPQILDTEPTAVEEKILDTEPTAAEEKILDTKPIVVEEKGIVEVTAKPAHKVHHTEHHKTHQQILDTEPTAVEELGILEVITEPAHKGHHTEHHKKHHQPKNIDKTHQQPKNIDIVNNPFNKWLAKHPDAKFNPLSSIHSDDLGELRPEDYMNEPMTEMQTTADGHVLSNKEEEEVSPAQTYLQKEHIHQDHGNHETKADEQRHDAEQVIDNINNLSNLDPSMISHAQWVVNPADILAAEHAAKGIHEKEGETGTPEETNEGEQVPEDPEGTDENTHIVPYNATHSIYVKLKPSAHNPHITDIMNNIGHGPDAIYNTTEAMKKAGQNHTHLLPGTDLDTAAEAKLDEEEHHHHNGDSYFIVIGTFLTIIICMSCVFLTCLTTQSRSSQDGLIEGSEHDDSSAKSIDDIKFNTTSPIDENNYNNSGISGNNKSGNSGNNQSGNSGNNQSGTNQSNNNSQNNATQQSNNNSQNNATQQSNNNSQNNTTQQSNQSKNSKKSQRQR